MFAGSCLVGLLGLKLLCGTRWCASMLVLVWQFRHGSLWILSSYASGGSLARECLACLRLVAWFCLWLYSSSLFMAVFG